MKQHTIIGMAGHIDHGKTALIKALTGIETDRAPEEKKRGITIDIGFAYWRDDVTIIDVPGHEKFVHNMVAGVSTVDFFLLVIAADDGVMPQTVEHLDILKFFGVEQGIAAITKSDLMDEEWLELMRSETESFLAQKGFSQIPIFNVSSSTGQGIEQLRAELISKIQNKHTRRSERPFRLNVDRSFTVKGYGQVVTGTVLSSAVHSGDSLILLPDETQVKVRAIQIHQHETEQVFSGQRAALNIGGAAKAKLLRGKVLAEPGSLEPARQLLARVTTTDYFDFRIKRHSLVRVHLGASELNGRLDWFEQESHLQKKKSFHLRIKFEDPAVCAPGDAILIRSLSPAITVAGGRVLQINPPKLKRDFSGWKTYMQTLSRGSLAERMQQFFLYDPYKAFAAHDLQRHFFENEQTVLHTLKALIKNKKVVAQEKNGIKFYFSLPALETVVSRIRDFVNDGLKENAARKGFNNAEIAAALKKPHISPFMLEISLKRALNKGVLTKYDNLYGIEDRSRDAQSEKMLRQISDIYAQARFNPPGIEQLSAELKRSKEEIKSLTRQLLKKEQLVSVGGQFYLHSRVFEELTAWIADYFKTNKELAVSAVRDFTASSRKFIIPLLEFLDHKLITERRGEVRIKGKSL